MKHIYDKYVNKIPECNLLHDIINTLKHIEHLNSHYSPIIHGCMNTRIDRFTFKNFQILLDSVYISTIVMERLAEKLKLEKDNVIKWHTKAGNITTNIKVKVYFTLPKNIATNFARWKYHAYDSNKCRYDMILGKYIITELGLN